MNIKTITRAGAGLLFIVGLVFSSSAYGQGWVRTYEFWQFESVFTGFSDIAQTDDGGYILVGSRLSLGFSELIILKTDQLGIEQWSRIDFQGVSGGMMHSIEQTSDGGYIVSGILTGGASGSAYLMKLDAAGEQEWASNFGVGGKSVGYEVTETSDGGFVMAGMELNFSDLPQAFALKVDASGGLLWEEMYGTADGNSFHSLVEMPDGGFAFAGSWQDTTTTEAMGLLIVRTDADGVMLWENKVLGTDTVYHNNSKEIHLATDGSLVVATHTRNGTPEVDVLGFPFPPTFNISLATHPLLVKVSEADGSTLWTNTYTGFPETATYSMDVTPDGGFILAGNQYNTFFQMKTDGNGVPLWAKIVGEDEYTGYVSTVLSTSLDEFILAGLFFDPFFSGFILSTDGLGNLFTNQLTGTVFNDINGNCIKDPGEDGWANRIVEVTPGPIYTMSDENGYYDITVGQGSHTVKVDLPFDYLWEQSCPADVYNVEFTAPYDTINNLDFGQYIELFCPFMTISVGTPLLRRCFDNTFSVTWCNEGTQSAAGVFIDMTFDDNLIVTGSSIPWEVPVVDGVYRFLIGDADIGECGTFTINTTVNCDAVLGSSACVEAHIFPDNYCEEFSPDWDESSIEVSSECLGDSIRFTITNAGVGDMTDPGTYRIYEDDLLSSTGMFQLLSGEELDITLFANGSTFRLDSDQCPGHPGFSNPQAIMELCGVEPFSLGFFTTTPEDDQDHFIEIDCATIIGSYDPNDKLVKPAGIQEPHYISPSDELEYKIRFQNTGNDTAFTVVIVDTLSQFINAASIHAMTASHPYEFELLGPAVCRWTFNDILLPDSTVNEPESHGFIRFKVSQRTGNAEGTVIENQAHIFFDFNAPIVTPLVYNTVFDQIVSVYYLPSPDAATVRIYPNPSNGFITIHAERQILQPMQMEFYNLLGQMVKEASIENGETLFTGDLPEGAYMYRLLENGQQLGSGKLVVE